MERLPDSTFVIVLSAPLRTRENDVSYEYRQSSDLYYLSGTHEPSSALLLASRGIEADGLRVRELLFVPPRTEYSELWLGRRFGEEGAEALLGIPAVSNERFEEIVGSILTEPSANLYVLGLPQGTEGPDALAEQAAVLSGYLSHDSEWKERSAQLRRHLNDLRASKTDVELDLMQIAIDLTTEALREAMAAIESGMYEYEVEALIQYVFHRGGSEYPAFPSIVGSGENGVILHYETNRRRMEDGDLVLMDVGAEYHAYAADVTRTVPVNGTFSEEQRALYQLVLDAQEAGIQASRAGNPFDAPHRAALAVLEEGLRRLGLIAGSRTVRDFFPHNTSHYLGLSVHDVRPTDTTLAPGEVITVEPGVYVRPSDGVDPRWWNIGIRIEDDVLITDDEPLVLSADAPRTVEDIEALMR